MAKASPIQPAYVAGELSPLIRGRTDNERWTAAMEICENFVPLIQGPLQKRPGTKFVSEVINATYASKLVPFEFSTTQTYVLEFSDLKLRILKNRGLVLTGSSKNITGISKANPAVVTSNSHGFSNGDSVYIAGVVGMTDVNNRIFTVANQAANTFELSGVNSTNYLTYTSGGTITKVYELASPYAGADIDEIRWTQSADTLYLFHPNYQPRKLTRTADNAWTFTVFDMDDGPYLEENETVTTLTPAETGHATAKMTAVNAPSGVVTDNATDADRWKAFDRDADTYFRPNTDAGWLQYDFGSGVSKIVDAYWLQTSGGQRANEAPSSWQILGSNDGVTFVTLDSRTKEDGWSAAERRYYEFANKNAFRYYRLKWEATEDGVNTVFTEWAMHQAASDQTPFNLTASSTTGINGGSGFLTTDVGRSIRLYGADNRWRWARIVARTSSTVVTIRLYGQALLNTDAIQRWQLGRYSDTTGWPANGAFFNDRLFVGGPGSEWYASQTGDYPNFGSKVDDGTTTDATAIAVPNLLNRQVNAVRWIVADEGALLLGTSGAEWTVRAANSNEGLSSTNILNRPATFRGSYDTPPVQVERATLFLSPDQKSIHEMAYVFEADGYRSPNLSWLAEHITADYGYTEFAHQKTPQSIVWLVREDGQLVSFTYEREQNVLAWARHPIADGDLLVERVQTVAGADNTTDVYLVLKKGSQRWICTLDPLWTNSNVIDDAYFVDGGILYDATPTTTVSGLWHLEGSVVAGTADGEHFTATVANGKITLSKSASKIAIGLPYTSKMQTMPSNAGATDGTAQGKTKRIHQVVFRVLNSRGGRYAYSNLSQQYKFNFSQLVSKNFTTAANLTTGDVIVRWPGEYAYDGVVYVEHDEPYPFTLIAHFPQIVTQDRG